MISYDHPTVQDIGEIVDLWNAAFGPQWPMTEKLLRQTMESDPYYEAQGCWLARDGAEIVGWVLAKSMAGAGPEVGRFQRRGGIGALCVRPSHQRRGIGSELLRRAEEFLKAHDVAPSTLYFPHHLLPGIPVECEAATALFRQRGYGGFAECFDLQRDLTGYAPPAKALAAISSNPRTELRPAREDEAEKVIDFVNREFAGGWSYSTHGHFERGGAATDIIIAVEDAEVIGFCHTADWRSRWLLPSIYWHPLLGERFGGLGPIGIAKEQRKRGLGLALCSVAVDALRSKGVQRMAIDWTTLGAFYAQLGFDVWKRYVQAQM